ncbi:MAG: AarF/ABC1/UbiB kinase family protein [Okeania sp. SIO2C2]|uniref:ABC1 kinase family protein n=1 Tax=Okeania sp. SIO2C2 TaxID=2607787 RepID=UPI0013B9AB3B|nr:AarF/ABC1/UbiB kinase family protein [Okeania sp. SIO2C2]NEP85631.1 AarF/ABC1/UbiB kinase family protein [Okeania sp. SIO2C2]
MLTQDASKSLRWQRTQYSPLTRKIDVFSAFGKFFFFLWWDNLFQNKSASVRKRRAKWLVRTMLDLGPTFIKIGQSLSTRADILPKEYVEELGKLQDNVPSFETTEAIAIIESELGNSLYSLYRDFQERPIAAASLGQVHKAKLQTGEEVVVKVQRPGLKSLFDLDVKVVKSVIRFCQKYFAWAKRYELDAIYYDFFKILYQEIDYVNEGKNADRFRENFKDYSEIIVPVVYWTYTTEKVITLEYLPGIKINDKVRLEACKINPKGINQIGVCCYLKQLLLDGFFQADPHPGNLAVSLDGGVIFYDFGMMAEVKSLTKDQMIKTFFAILRKDVDQVLNTLITIGLIEPMPDIMPVKRLVNFLLENFTDKPVDFYNFDEIKEELYVLFEQQPFRLPSQMIFILKSLSTLDGIARNLDPDYSLVTCAQPFVKSITVAQGRGRVVGELAKQTRDFIKYKLQQPSKSEILIRQLETKIEDGEIQFRVRSIENDRLLKRINLALKILIYTCFSGFTFLSASVLFVGGSMKAAIVVCILSGLGFILVLKSGFQLSFREKLDKMPDK